MSSHTVTKSTSWFERLGKSFGGIIFGIILFIAGSILLWWNEGNFVKTKAALQEAQGVLQKLEDINTVDTARNGELVHATGTAVTEDILADPIFGISVNAIRLERAVEYYQWMEDKKTEKKQKMGGGEEEKTTYTYHKDWVTSPVESSRFVAPGAPEEHKNTVVADIKKDSWQAENVAFGAYRLPKSLVNSITGSESLPVELSEEAITKLTGSLPASSPTPAPPAQGTLFDNEEKAEEQTVAPSSSSWIHVDGSTVYLGQNPASPTIGDVRVSFKRTKPSNEVSIVAKMIGDTFEPYTAKNGRTVSMLSVGTHSAENMFASAHASNTMLTWILRFVGVFLICLSIALILAPLSVLASVIPFLGKLVGVGTGLVSLLFGTAWSLTIIALAWLFYRPLIGIALLMAAVLLIVCVFTRKRSGTP